MIYIGTSVVAGSARAVVAATGAKTELGYIAGLLRRQQPEPAPIQRRLAELGCVLIVVCLALGALAFLLNLLRGGDPPALVRPLVVVVLHVLGNQVVHVLPPEHDERVHRTCGTNRGGSYAQAAHSMNSPRHGQLVCLD